MASVTDALAEAYATQPAGEIVIETLEFNNVTFSDPVRIATGVPFASDTVSSLPDPVGYSGPRYVLNDADGYTYVYLPLSLAGPKAWFIAAQVNVKPPGMTADGPTPMRIRIDNVASLMLPYLRSAVQATDAIGVTYRSYTTTDFTQPGEIIGDLELRDVDLSPIAAEGSVGFRAIELQAFPLQTYDEEFYPTLQSQ